MPVRAMSRLGPEGGRRCLQRALDWRRSAAARGNGPLVVPVARGRAGLVSARDRRQLVSLLDPAAVDVGRGGLRGWLERRQARRSELLLVPDRDTGMRFAGRWRLDLARIRAIPDLGNPPAELIQRCLGDAASRRGRPKPWHAL